MTVPESGRVEPNGVPPLDVLLEARGVSKRFGGLTAVDNVDLVIPRGAIQGLIGPNGAGKTTFFNLIAGIYQPTEGEVVFDGEAIQRPGGGWLRSEGLRPDQ